MSKRTCGFLTTSVAKHLELPKDSERLVNSFLMKPRDYYNYVHGTPPRHKAYTLCLAAIHNAGLRNLVRNRYRNVFWVEIEETALLLEMKDAYGVQLSSSLQTISREENVRLQLDCIFMDFEHNNRYNETILEMAKRECTFPHYLTNFWNLNPM